MADEEEGEWYRPLTPQPFEEVVNEPQFEVKRYGTHFKRNCSLPEGMESRAKIMKLERPPMEEIQSKKKMVASSVDNSDYSRPKPTFTRRSCCTIPIRMSDVRELCGTCYGVKCVCSLIGQTNTTSTSSQTC